MSTLEIFFGILEPFTECLVRVRQAVGTCILVVGEQTKAWGRGDILV